MKNYFLPTDPNVFRAFIHNSFEQGITQSELMTRADCIRKWYFSYVLGLKRKGSFSWALLFGDVVHQMLEQQYKHKQYHDHAANICPAFRYPDDMYNDEGRVMYAPGQVEEEYYWKNLAEIYVAAHARHWEEVESKYQIESVERLAEVEYRGFKLTGKIDLEFKEIRNRVVGKTVWILDHKTTYDINESLVLGWQFRFQFLFYSWMYWKITGSYPGGVVVNALKKPAERRSKAKGESIDGFLTRVKKNIQIDPAHYFRRDKLPFDKHTLPRFQKLILDPIITQLEWTLTESHRYGDSLDGSVLENLYSLLFSANTNHCWHYNRPCPFLDLCQNAFEDHAEEYTIRTHKHEELQQHAETQED